MHDVLLVLLILFICVVCCMLYPFYTVVETTTVDGAVIVKKTVYDVDPKVEGQLQW